MGRPPCCEKTGVKKGPWTPEEDLILVDYTQQNGPGNWRAVPVNTGLNRCSKSCRLRWTNYLRPGIKRGSFTATEEKRIIDLQKLLGNKWAAIASYLPQRTDNDIKNYWNTHLKKKLNKAQGINNGDQAPASSETKGQWERKLQTNIHMAKKALREALSIDKSTPLPTTTPAALPVVAPPKPTAIAGLSLAKDNVDSIPEQLSPKLVVPNVPAESSPATYAVSAENVSRLLRNWMVNVSPKSKSQEAHYSSSGITNQIGTSIGFGTLTEGRAQEGRGFNPIFSFNSSNSSCDASIDDATNFAGSAYNRGLNLNLNNQIPPLNWLEEWLHDEVVAPEPAPAQGGQHDPSLTNMSFGQTSRGFF